MTDEFDRMVSGEDEIVPSSGFVASVMEAVRHEAAAPQPIAFPWIRALPGLIALGVVFAAGCAAAVHMVQEPVSSRYSSSAAAEVWMHSLIQYNVGWIALALLLTLLSILFSIRLTKEQV
jgi:hypothetical protein